MAHTSPPGGVPASLADLLGRTADAVGDAVSRLRPEDLRHRGDRPGQYHLDLVADEAAMGVLRGAGVGVLSEESGLSDPGSAVVVVVDPVDGSTNASRGLPWCATSIAAVLDGVLAAALVQNLATGRRWSATAGGGATCDGQPVRVSSVDRMGDAVVAINGHTPAHLGWRQYRSMGATALDLCAVADGSFDASVDCTTDELGPWDYLGGTLVVSEAGGRVVDAVGRDLVVLDHAARRSPVAAGTGALLDEALRRRVAVVAGA